MKSYRLSGATFYGAFKKVEIEIRTGQLSVSIM